MRKLLSLVCPVIHLFRVFEPSVDNTALDKTLLKNEH